MPELFREVLSEIEGEISEANYKTWFKGVSLIELDREAKVAQIGVPSVFVSKQLEVRYYDLIREAFKHKGVEVERLEFSLRSATHDKVKSVVARNEEGIPYGGGERASSLLELAEKRSLDSKRSQFSTGLNSKYKFLKQNNYEPIDWSK